MSAHIYKIFRRHEWQSLQSSSSYLGSDDDKRDGFIHFSTLEQTPKTLEKYFSDETEVFIAGYEATAFNSEKLRWEKSRGGALFPHLYAPITSTCHKTVWHLTRTDQSSFDLSALVKDTAQ